MRYFLYNFELFLLVFIRMFGLFVVSPFLASPMIKSSLKYMTAFLITVVIFPVVSRAAPAIPDNIYFFLGMLVSEFMIGMVIGFIAAVFFAIFQLAGEYFSLLMGLRISEVLDPITQIEIPIIGQFQTMIAMLIFLGISGDHDLIRAVYGSYSVLPLLDLSNMAQVQILVDGFGSAVSRMFFLSLKLALPLMGTLVVLVVSLALLSKAAPQMNIFMVGFPVQLAVGYTSLIILSTVMARIVRRIFEIMNGNIMTLIRALGLAA